MLRCERKWEVSLQCQDNWRKTCSSNNNAMDSSISVQTDRKDLIGLNKSVADREEYHRVQCVGSN